MGRLLDAWHSSIRFTSMLLNALKVIALATALESVSTTAEDWPEFRGPTGQGVSFERNLPVEWSGAKNVAWKTAIRGLGWSSPVVSQGRVYLTTAITNGASQ